MLSLLVLLTILYIVYYFLNKENKDEILSNKDIKSLPNTIIINKKRKPNIKKQNIKSDIIPVDIPVDIQGGIIPRNRRTINVYRNEEHLKMDPNNSCYMKYKNNNRKYTGYIDFNTKQICEYDDDSDDIQIVLYPNVRGYVKNGKIIDDLNKRVLIDHSWAYGDTFNYYPKLKINPEGIRLTDNDKVILKVIKE